MADVKEEVWAIWGIQGIWGCYGTQLRKELEETTVKRKLGTTSKQVYGTVILETQEDDLDMWGTDTEQLERDPIQNLCYYSLVLW